MKPQIAARLIAYFEHPRAFYAILLIGLVVRAGLLFLVADIPLGSDALSYHKMAIGLLGGGHLETFFPPGLALYLATVYRFFGASFLVGRASMLFWYIVLSSFLYLLTSTIVPGRKRANLAVIILACYPSFVWQSVEPLSQLPASACLLAGCYLLLRVTQSHRLLTATILGLVLAALALTRSSSVLLVGLAPIYVWRNTKDWRIPIAVLVVAGGCIFGWVVKAHELTGRYFLINEANAMNFFLGNNPYTPLYKTWWLSSHGSVEEGVPVAFTQLYAEIRSLPMPEQEQRLRQLSIEHVATRPDLFAVRTFSRVRSYFAFDTGTGSSARQNYGSGRMSSLMLVAMEATFFLSITVLTIVFLVRFAKFDPAFNGFLLLLSASLAYASPYWVSFSHPTYHIPVVPILTVFASCMLADAAKEGAKDCWASLTKRRRVVLLVSLALLIAIQIEWIAANAARA
jgi:4-amino-4-deoxy-L-arabinose transferase-like glycosyltransferase